MGDTVNVNEAPTLEEDMMRFPNRSRLIVTVARHLWKVGMVSFVFDNKVRLRYTGEAFHASRNGLCGMSPLFERWLPTERSWPIIYWSSIFSTQNPECREYLWIAMKAYHDFVCLPLRWSLPRNHAEFLVYFAEVVEDPVLYQVAMGSLQSRVSDFSVYDAEVMLIDILEDEVSNIDDVEKCYTSRPLVELLMDLIVWYSVVDICEYRGRRTRPPLLGNVHNCLQQLMSNARKNPPQIAPFNIERRSHYLRPRFNQDPSVKLESYIEPDNIIGELSMGADGGEADA